MQKLTESDRWMIRNWKKAKQFEDAMSSTRQRYEGLFHEVRIRVKQQHRNLEELCCKKLSERVSEDEWEYGGGCAGFSHPEWRGAWPSWPSGIWVSNISLDEIATEAAPKSNVSIWLNGARRANKRVEELRHRLVAKSSELHKQPSLCFQERDPRDSNVCLFYELPEDPPKLLEMVLTDNGQPFVDYIAEHVRKMANLLRGLDRFLR